MNQAERRHLLIEEFAAEDPRLKNIALPPAADQQKRLLRSLMNVRDPKPLSAATLRRQDEYLQEDLKRRGIVSLDAVRGGEDASAYPTTDPRMFIWQGDITRLAVDAIVNAANNQLLGCFVPCHGCIDNAIHTYAGVQLRLACWEIMQAQGHAEPTGQAKITPGFNLPAKHVLHTVGPIVHGRMPSAHDQELLASCYTSCLNCAHENGLESIAFCCISTGEFGYPPDAAARTAIATVRAWLNNHTDSNMTVVFNVFKDSDLVIYQNALSR